MNKTSSALPEIYQEHHERINNIRQAKIAVSTLNQHVLDFAANKQKIIQSITQAREEGATYRIGPELEVCGYSCEDHFYEEDTIQHSYEVLADILNSNTANGILCTIGMPVIHAGVRYNCDVYILGKKIIGIKPKKNMANDGNYREGRWFTQWSKNRVIENFQLPQILKHVTKQTTVPFGDFLIETNDTVLGSEKCEEMFTLNNPSIHMALDGAELIGNSSGSHWELRKIGKRIDLIRGYLSKASGVYAYSNLIGGDGGRLVFDGGSVIAQNGKILAQAPQFSLKEVINTTAVVSFSEVQSRRGSTLSTSEQADHAESYPRIYVDFDLCQEKSKPSKEKKAQILSPEEEIAKGPALWLWDYLRRSGATAFFLPLSGGVDSSATASIVGSMCHMVFEEIQQKNTQVLKELRKIIKDENFTPKNSQEIANKIFVTCYQPNEGTSSRETEMRAQKLAEEIGAHHIKVGISKIVSAVRETIETTIGKKLQFASEGGSTVEDLALQNMQARTRNSLTYALSSVIKFIIGREGAPLILGSSNVDEANRGYYTKYDCSSADINPIGGIGKVDLRNFLQYAAETFGYTTLLDVLSAAHTAELTPMQDNTVVQTDEIDMGMSYDELRMYSILRKERRMGPVSMYQELQHVWGPGSERNLSKQEVAQKVKQFFYYYTINRHKTTTLTPSLHAEAYSPDDNRFDLRPFLLNSKWEVQFAIIDALVEMN